jgi:hypothetical protein
MKMIHEIGLEVRSSAVCTSVRRIRYGHFTLTHAMLTKHCDARSIAENIDFCRPLVDKPLTNRQSDVISSRRPDQIYEGPSPYRTFDDDPDSTVTLSANDRKLDSELDLDKSKITEI